MEWHWVQFSLYYLGCYSSQQRLNTNVEWCNICNNESTRELCSFKTCSNKFDIISFKAFERTVIYILPLIINSGEAAKEELKKFLDYIVKGFLNKYTFDYSSDCFNDLCVDNGMVLSEFSGNLIEKCKFIHLTFYISNANLS